MANTCHKCEAWGITCQDKRFGLRFLGKPIGLQSDGRVANVKLEDGRTQAIELSEEPIMECAAFQLTKPVTEVAGQLGEIAKNAALLRALSHIPGM